MRYVLLFLLGVISQNIWGQTFTTNPTFPFADQSMTLDVDVTGTSLEGYSGDVWIWAWLDNATSDVDAPTNVNPATSAQSDALMTRSETNPNLYAITFVPATFLDKPVNDVLVLGFKLKSVDWSDNIQSDNDRFVTFSTGQLDVLITSPTQNPYFANLDETFTISASASETADLSITINGVLVATSSGTEISYEETASGTNLIEVIVSAMANGVTSSESFDYIVRYATEQVSRPVGVVDGANYDESDLTKVTLSLLAPGKSSVYAVGSFSNWKIDPIYKLKQDGDNFWVEITGLISNQEYIYQYLVDETLRIGDPFSDKILDPDDDAFIPDAVYPNLIEYRNVDYGNATVFQTGQDPFPWAASEDTWVRPSKDKLVVYELLVRDFLGSHSYLDLIDTLSYLKRLGVNAIELMPIMEFEGNESWGYNPSYYFAPDKYYGTKDNLKSFIQAAHENGFAVILDMVLNHSFGESPMVQMYWDGGKPSSDNPWFNPDATHPFNVGFDFNHESQYTKDFVDKVNAYWVEEYHFDGFRFDLSKGFTQKQSNNDSVFRLFDQSRIDILTRMASALWQVDNQAYVILEHFAESSEENVLQSIGMLTWGNATFDYGDVVKGITSKNFASVYNRRKVSYMESHDEDRLIYKTLTAGGSEGSYNIKDINIGLDRVKAAAAFFYTVPGPKMMWQFQELGYDIDINLNGRVGNKPLPWGIDGLGYYENEQRQKLYKVHAAIINLTNDYANVFDEGNFAWISTGDVRRINISHAEMDVTIIGNFATSNRSIDANFDQVGTWYDFFGGGSLEVSDINAAIDLAPGEFRIYTSIEISRPESNLVRPFKPILTTNPTPFKASESVKIIFDATAADPNGTAGLIGADKVYMFSGVILDSPNGTTWSNIVGTTDQDDGVGAMTRVVGESDKWEITITPNQYFDVSSTETIYRLAMTFRDATGTNLGTDIGGQDLLLNVELESPIVVTDPEVFGASSIVRIIFDASVSDPAGTSGLIGATKVYMHSGVITDSPTGTAWTNVIGNWGLDDGIGLMTKVPGEQNKWEITLTPRSYYSVNSGTPIYRLGMVFRNADGSAEGKANGAQDVFVEVSQNILLANEAKIAEQIQLYPNPTKGNISFTSLLHNDALKGIQVFNLGGKLQKINRVEIDGETAKADLSNLSNGVYLVQLKTSNSIKVYRVILTK